MILIENFNQVTAQIESERGISKDILISAIEQALVSAVRKKFSEEALLEGHINSDSGEVKIYLRKTVVKKVADADLEILLKEAQALDPAAKVDGTVLIEIAYPEFGRIAAQTAKQVIIQRIREAEKNAIFDEFISKEGQMITGTVQRIENLNYLINLGRAEAILYAKEQIPGERFSLKEKIRVFLSNIDRTVRGPVLNISRAHPGMLKCLFEAEVPEIQDGIIEIMSVAREAGKRSKIAVKSNNPSIGAVGTCVGHMGARIQAVTKELGAEKIDILEWNENPKVFIGNALKPSKITEVIITDEAAKTAIVVVPNDQLSLAIGKSGINVRLSVRLTGWKLDIFSEDEYSKKEVELRQKSHLSIVEKIQLDKEKERQSQSDSASEKIKVSDLAKELGIKSKELVEKAAELGIAVKGATSSLNQDQATQLRNA
ncbi:MAG: transcription termination factor NusA [Candidatus Margulisiibacteriota bacterium]